MAIWREEPEKKNFVGKISVCIVLLFFFYFKLFIKLCIDLIADNAIESGAVVGEENLDDFDDSQNEEQWRKQRYERETYLRELMVSIFS